jgi:hypothetical protein
MKLCQKCSKNPVPLMRKICDSCKKQYQREYSIKNKDKKRETTREWMRTRRWLNGGERWDDLGPDIPYKAKSINGILKIQ